jgi:hypothetical protein
MDISIDLFEGKCKFHVNTNVDGETYMGVFTCKGSLSSLDSVKSDRKYRELMGDNIKYATEHASQMAFCLSQLQYRLTEFPDWWNNEEIGGGHLDKDVIFEVFNGAIEAEMKYREKRKEQADSHKKKL